MQEINLVIVLFFLGALGWEYQEASGVDGVRWELYLQEAMKVTTSPYLRGNMAPWEVLIAGAYYDDVVLLTLAAQSGLLSEDHYREAFAVAYKENNLLALEKLISLTDKVPSYLFAYSNVEGRDSLQPRTCLQSPSENHGVC